MYTKLYIVYILALLCNCCHCLSPDIKRYLGARSGPPSYGARTVTPKVAPLDNNGILGDDSIPFMLVGQPQLVGIPAPELKPVIYRTVPAALPQFGLWSQDFAEAYFESAAELQKKYVGKTPADGVEFGLPNAGEFVASLGPGAAQLRNVWNEGEGLYLDEFKDLAKDGAKEALGSLAEQVSGGKPVFQIAEQVFDHIEKSLDQDGVTNIAKYAATAAFLAGNPFTSAIGTVAFADQLYDKFRPILQKIPVVKEIIKPVEKVRNFVKEKIEKPINKFFKPVEKFAKKAVKGVKHVWCKIFC